EPWTIDWLETCLRPGEVLYDIGANIGAYALVAAKVSGGQARVYAFEPGFANFAALCQNIVLNGCGECVVPLPIALGEKAGMMNWKYRNLSPGAASHALGGRLPGLPGESCRTEAPYEQLMPVHRLDDLLTQFGLPFPNHIKLDVDGTELEVLR